MNDNLFEQLPASLPEELVNTLLQHGTVRIERIVSKGHVSPAQGWYDQDEHEWVVVLRGWGQLQFEDGTTVRLHAGDHLHIPAHQRHRVTATAENQHTVWLAVFYSA